MLRRISDHDDVIFRVKSDLVAATLRAGGNRRDGAQIKRRLRLGQVKDLHRPMGICGPQLVVRGPNTDAGSHSLDSSTGVVRRTHSVKPRDPTQEQIILGVEDIHAGIASFAEVVPRPGLIHPTDVKGEGIARQENRTNKFGGFVETISWTRRSPARLGDLILILRGAGTPRQGRNHRQCQGKTDELRIHNTPPLNGFSSKISSWKSFSPT